MTHLRNGNMELKNSTFYSIRKFRGIGAVSIIIASFYLLNGNYNIAYAEQNNINITSNTQDNSSNSNSTEQNNNHQATQLNKTPLINLINQYKKIDLSNKTPESVKTFKEEISKAEQFVSIALNQKDINLYFQKFINIAGRLQTISPNTNQTSVTIQNKNDKPKASQTKQTGNITSSDIRFREAASDVNTNTSIINNDPLKANETNTSIINGHFDHVSGGNLPAPNQGLTIVKGVEGWTTLSKDSNPEFPIARVTKARNYGSYMSDGKAPFGVVIARTTDGYNRSVLDPKVAGIYQDIDVTPGSELVVNFISTSLAFSDGVSGVRLKLTNPEGNIVLFNRLINAMQSYPTGKINVMVNVPKNLNKVRVTFTPMSNRSTLTSTKTNSDYGFGTSSQNMHGGVVSKVEVNTGAFVETKVAKVSYSSVASTTNSNLARETISLNIINKGHTQSKDTLYKVILPQGSKLVSANNAKANFNDKTGVLTLNTGNINPGKSKLISYTVDLPASAPNTIDLNGNVTYKTNANFRGNDKQKSGTNEVEPQQITILMNKINLREKVLEIEEYLKTLSENDYNTDSLNHLKETLTNANSILNEENENTQINDRKNQMTINQITEELELSKVKLKKSRPIAPTILIDEENGKYCYSTY